MNKRFLSALMILTIIFSMAMAVEAKSDLYFSTGKVKEGFVQDRQGNLYIYKNYKEQTGWISYRGHRYYAHKSKSYCCPTGSLSVNTYRVEKDKIYYLCGHGEMLTKSTKYIKLNRDNSVKYIYIPGDPTTRYNVKHTRYQTKENGKWKDTGMECYPYWLIDWQY